MLFKTALKHRQLPILSFEPNINASQSEGVEEEEDDEEEQFSSRPSLVPSVTVVLLNLVTGGKWGEGRLAKPGAGLIQPLCRRDGRPGCQGQKPKNLAPRLLAGAEAGRVPRACLRDLR